MCWQVCVTGQGREEEEGCVCVCEKHCWGGLMLIKMFPNTWWLMAGVGSQGLMASLSRCIAQAQGYVCYNLSLLTPQQGLTLQKQSHLDTKLSLVEFIWIALLGCLTINWYSDFQLYPDILSSKLLLQKSLYCSWSLVLYSTVCISL